MNITEKVAYLKGLAEGLQLDSKSKEGKLLLAMVDVLDDIAYTVADLEDEVAQLNELTEELDEDLSELESFCYDEEDEDEDDDLDAFDEDDFYEITWTAKTVAAPVRIKTNHSAFKAAAFWPPLFSRPCSVRTLPKKCIFLVFRVKIV